MVNMKKKNITESLSAGKYRNNSNGFHTKQPFQKKTIQKPNNDLKNKFKQHNQSKFNSNHNNNSNHHHHHNGHKNGHHNGNHNGNHQHRNGVQNGQQQQSKAQDTQSEINNILKREQNLLERRIKFVPAKMKDTADDEMRARYTPINNVSEIGLKGAKKNGKKNNHKDDDNDDNDSNSDDENEKQTEILSKWKDYNGLKTPRVTLFSEEKAEALMKQKPKILKVGAGLTNAGNTCYMNSTLQCILYTPGFLNYLCEGKHSQECRIDKNSFCAFCDLEVLAQKSMKGNLRSIHPKQFTSRVKQVAKHFRHGRQEDAHEYLRHLIDSLQKSCLYDYDKNIDDRLKETSLIHQFFGGYLRSQVQCLSCKYESNTFEATLDISIDVASSVEKSLRTFRNKEVLDKQNKYHCDKCNKKVVAHKSYSIHVAPRILCLHIKRFGFASIGRKIKTKQSYDEYLNLAPYMSSHSNTATKNSVEQKNLTYRLFAVNVHAGSSVHSGHYYSYCRAPNEMWYQLDDDDVTKCSLKTVLKQQAYMLFYMQVQSSDKAMSIPSEIANPQHSEDQIEEGDTNLRQKKKKQQEQKQEEQKEQEQEQKLLTKKDVKPKNLQRSNSTSALENSQEKDVDTNDNKNGNINRSVSSSNLTNGYDQDHGVALSRSETLDVRKLQRQLKKKERKEMKRRKLARLLLLQEQQQQKQQQQQQGSSVGQKLVVLSQEKARATANNGGWSVQVVKEENAVVNDPSEVDEDDNEDDGSGFQISNGKIKIDHEKKKKKPHHDNEEIKKKDKDSKKSRKKDKKKKEEMSKTATVTTSTVTTMPSSKDEHTHNKDNDNDSTTKETITATATAITTVSKGATKKKETFVVNWDDGIVDDVGMDIKRENGYKKASLKFDGKFKDNSHVVKAMRKQRFSSVGSSVTSWDESSANSIDSVPDTLRFQRNKDDEEMDKGKVKKVKKKNNKRNSNDQQRKTNNFQYQYEEKRRKQSEST